MKLQDVMKEHLSSMEQLFKELKQAEDVSFISQFVPELANVEGQAIAMNILGIVCGYLTTQGVPPAKIGALVIALSATVREVAPHLVDPLPQGD